MFSLFSKRIMNFLRFSAAKSVCLLNNGNELWKKKDHKRIFFHFRRMERIGLQSRANKHKACRIAHTLIYKE